LNGSKPNVYLLSNKQMAARFLQPLNRYLNKSLGPLEKQLKSKYFPPPVVKSYYSVGRESRLLI